MDSIADLPPVSAVPEHHSVTPAPPPSSNGAHPPYSDMIIAAIVGLKDKDGSSRQAIAKYIEKEFANLPSTHSNLLTHHLKRMKNEGQLMMVKHSYMLPAPRSVPFQPPTLPIDHNYPLPNANDTSAFKPENSSVTPRRKPGRPPKPRHDFGFQAPEGPPPTAEIPPYQPQFDHQLGGGNDFQSGQDLQSQYGSGQEFQGNYASGGAEPIFASLGLADDGVAPPPENTVVSAKRGRGRPPKNGGVSRSVVPSSGAGASGDVTVSDGGGAVEAGRRGRRRKAGRPKLMSITMVNGGGLKRGIGRGRGRPRRIGGPVTVPLSGNVMRPRGRPRRAVNGGATETGSVSRGRGRPPKNSGGANKVMKSDLQSFGRLSEGEPGNAVIVTDPHQLVAYQELKSKYEHLQSKAKEVLGVVRPYINPDYAAFGALQELETLVETDPNAPVQTENPPSYV